MNPAFEEESAFDTLGYYPYRLEIPGFISVEIKVYSREIAPEILTQFSRFIQTVTQLLNFKTKVPQKTY